MPNHVDVRAFFIGPKASLEALSDRCRQAFAKPSGFLSAWNAEAGSTNWRQAFRTSHERGSEPNLPEGYCGLPRVGEQAPFTFEAATPMPQSLMAEDSSWAEVGKQILTGQWSKVSFGHADAPRLRACSDLEQAKAWARENIPGALEAGQTKIDNIREHGHDGWYSWSVANWGTKWDAYDCAWRETQLGGRFQEVRMNTAWSPPLPALSNICKQFKIGCACSYIDEGGGFAAYSFIDDQGKSDGPIEPVGGHRSVAAAARARAKHELETLGAAEPKKSKPKSKPWPQLLAEGELPTAESLIAPGAPAARGAQAADLAFRCFGEGSSLSCERAGAALRELSRLGALLPEDPTSMGHSIGLVLCASRWREGAAWALELSTGAAARENAMCLMFSALERNDPASATSALEILTAEDFSCLDWALAARHSPEAALAVAKGAKIPQEALEAFEEALRSLQGGKVEVDRQQGLIAEVQRERLARDLLGEAPKSTRAPNL